jgi:hypothetical protein
MADVVSAAIQEPLHYVPESFGTLTAAAGDHIRNVVPISKGPSDS